jgi:hypothetical protein
VCLMKIFLSVFPCFFDIGSYQPTFEDAQRRKPVLAGRDYPLVVLPKQRGTQVSGADHPDVTFSIGRQLKCNLIRKQNIVG